MAESEWSFLTGGLDSPSVDRGVTAGITGPASGAANSFIYGFNSLAVVAGSVGLFTNLADFAPMSKGGSIRGALQRGSSGGQTNWSTFLFIGGQGTAVTDGGYMLGLSDDDPSSIVLMKAPAGVGLSGGLPAGSPDPTVSGILRKSTETVAIGTWMHLRLDMVVNGTGDVVLKCFKNDLTTGTVDSPIWVAIAGMDDFIDDALSINTGSAPYTSGRIGFGYATTDVTRRGFVDHVEAFRQT